MFYRLGITKIKYISNVTYLTFCAICRAFKTMWHFGTGIRTGSCS